MTLCTRSDVSIHPPPSSVLNFNFNLETYWLHVTLCMDTHRVIACIDFGGHFWCNSIDKMVAWVGYMRQCSKMSHRTKVGRLFSRIALWAGYMGVWLCVFVCVTIPHVTGVLWKCGWSCPHGSAGYNGSPHSLIHTENVWNMKSAFPLFQHKPLLPYPRFTTHTYLCDSAWSGEGQPMRIGLGFPFQPISSLGLYKLIFISSNWRQ